MYLHIGNTMAAIVSQPTHKHAIRVILDTQTSTLGWRDIIRTEERAKKLQVTHGLEWQVKAKYSNLSLTIGPPNNVLLSLMIFNSILVLQAVNKLQEDLENRSISKTRFGSLSLHNYKV